MAKEQRKPRNARLNKDLGYVEKQILKEPMKKEDAVPKSNDNSILNTDTSNKKYCKKEIESNWNKYETRMETYDEIENKANMGADFEALSRMPVSSDSHFQFKHEKVSLDSTHSEYDKHFQFHTDILSAAIMSIPFFERNSLGKSIFSSSEIMNMLHRSEKFARKYESIQEMKSEISASLVENIEEKSETDPNNTLNNSPPIRKVDDVSDGVDPGLVCKLRKQAISERLVTESINKAASKDDITNENIEVISNVSELETKAFSKDLPKTTLSRDLVESSSQDLEQWLDDFLEN